MSEGQRCAGFCRRWKLLPEARELDVAGLLEVSRTVHPQTSMQAAAPIQKFLTVNLPLGRRLNYSSSRDLWPPACSVAREQSLGQTEHSYGPARDNKSLVVGRTIVPFYRWPRFPRTFECDRERHRRIQGWSLQVLRQRYRCATIVAVVSA